MAHHSRGPSQSMRTLTLTEELERLEQSITLTLQEIDHNFSRAHRIVTSSILPVVEQYAKHSEAVWEGSKFWKQFFEASANVSLSGYEEVAGEEEGTLADHSLTETAASDEESVGNTPGADVATPDRRCLDVTDYADMDESVMTSPSVAIGTNYSGSGRQQGLTAGQNKTTRQKTVHTVRSFDSPYESLKRELEGSSPAAAPPTSTVVATEPTTPGKQSSALPDMSMTPTSSPFATHATATAQKAHNTGNTDVLLHRMLDKTYRVAATPHTAQRTAARQAKYRTTGATPQTGARGSVSHLLDFSPDSSPEAPAPQLRAELFSPAKARTPGVTVQHVNGIRKRARQSDVAGTDYAAEPAAAAREPGVERVNAAVSGRGWDSDSDSGLDEVGFSPPKTIQFHIPQSRMLQTPARAASKRIVEDLLLTAGGDFTDDLEDGEGPTEENSPSVVRERDALDDSF